MDELEPPGPGDAAPSPASASPTAAAPRENRMEKCADPNQRHRFCPAIRLNPVKKNQMHSSVNCSRALELLRPTVFKVAIKKKYEIGPTDQYLSITSSHKSPESSQLRRGKVAWTNTTAPVKGHIQPRPKPDSRRCSFRSTEPKSNAPAENRMPQITGKYKLSTNQDADGHLSRKEDIGVEASCEIDVSSRFHDSEFQETKVNARETLHLYLPSLDIQEEEEYPTAREPDAGVSQTSEESTEDMKIKGKDKNITKIQESNRIKRSAWACQPGGELKGQMQKRPSEKKYAHPTSVTCYFGDTKKYSEAFQDRQNGLDEIQPIKHNSRNDAMLDLKIYDLEAEPDDGHALQENSQNNSNPRSKENPTPVTVVENDRERTKIHIQRNNLVFNTKESAVTALPMTRHLTIRQNY
ncbi:uncharacterized protein LOC116990795 isoform X2 [Amblyraja radiata]|uniref:uncharacterized protein LOC116990795 isoform X2 n=1 Tax=Amblyraja radiata TaxID=386614 RepID=UPI0014024C11|nr:uncharacterized protein LOC116990795 isoform X2 [Amblyraja radiata]